MKFLLVNTDYPEFLRSLYAQHKGLKSASYDEQMRVRAASLFGDAGFYADNIRKTGHDAMDVFINNEHMQKAWAREHGVSAGSAISGLAERPPFRQARSLYRRAAKAPAGKPGWFYRILAAQVEEYMPDVLYVQNIMDVDNGFLRECRARHKTTVIGQHAAMPLPQDRDFSAYDLFISSFPPTVEYFRKRGFRAEFIKLAFEPDVLKSLTGSKPKYDLTFIGSLYPIHSTRIELLERLCTSFPQMKVWGPGVDNLAKDSPIRKCYAGQAWGREMFQILRDSRITINHHGNVPPYANNMRLYEATGVGALLVTDWKENLKDIFAPGREVAAYKDAEECINSVRYYLDHEDERETIARAGQERTMIEHNYFNRMQELVSLVGKQG